MTLEEAKNNIGRKVIYIPGKRLGFNSFQEVGVVTSVNPTFVFVKYGDDQISKATHAEDLELEVS